MISAVSCISKDAACTGPAKARENPSRSLARPRLPAALARIGAGSPRRKASAAVSAAAYWRWSSGRTLDFQAWNAGAAARRRSRAPSVMAAVTVCTNAANAPIKRSASRGEMLCTVALIDHPLRVAPGRGRHLPVECRPVCRLRAHFPEQRRDPSRPSCRQGERLRS